MRRGKEASSSKAKTISMLLEESTGAASAGRSTTRARTPCPPPPPVRRWVEGKLFHPEFLVPAGPGREEPFPSSPPPAETAGIIRPIGTVWPSADSNPPIGNTAARLAPACVDPPEVACPPPTTPRTDGGGHCCPGWLRWLHPRRSRDGKRKRRGDNGKGGDGQGGGAPPA